MTPCWAIHGMHGPHERPRAQARSLYISTSFMLISMAYVASSLVRSVVNLCEIREWPRECAVDGPVDGPVDGLAPRGDVERPAASTGLFTGPPTGPDATRFTGPFTGVFSPATARGCSRDQSP